MKTLKANRGNDGTPVNKGISGIHDSMNTMKEHAGAVVGIAGKPIQQPEPQDLPVEMGQSHSIKDMLQGCAEEEMGMARGTIKNSKMGMGK